jgi:glutamate--cysteine ligase
MSDVGYQSSVQNDLRISYNNLDEFINAIIRGIKTSVQDFQDIGLLDKNGVPQQISTGILQIENELYDIVRPKRSGPSGSRPATLLKEQGIEYLELRGIDINPFIPEGIDENKIKLLDVYIMHSLISKSPEVSDKEIEEMRANQKIMVGNGRSKDIKLRRDGEDIQLLELKAVLHDELKQVASAMDEYCSGYSNAVDAEMSVDCLPSERIMNEISSQNISFQEYALNQSKKIADELHSSNKNDFEGLIHHAKESQKDLKNLQKNTGMDINKYVELYNSKI